MSISFDISYEYAQALIEQLQWSYFIKQSYTLFVFNLKITFIDSFISFVISNSKQLHLWNFRL